MIKTLNDIKQEVSLQGGTDLIDFNIRQGTITLKDSIFAQVVLALPQKQHMLLLILREKLKLF